MRFNAPSSILIGLLEGTSGRILHRLIIPPHKRIKSRFRKGLVNFSGQSLPACKALTKLFFAMLRYNFLKYFLSVLFLGIVRPPAHVTDSIRLLVRGARRIHDRKSIPLFMKESIEKTGHFVLDSTNGTEPGTCCVWSIHDGILGDRTALTGKSPSVRW
jgi:hypothetical protein